MFEETFGIHNKIVAEEPNLDIGTIVYIKNEQHVWHNELAIIIDKKHKHYRVELNGKKIWISEHWVKLDDYR